MKLGHFTVTRTPSHLRKPRKQLKAYLPETVRALSLWLVAAQGFAATVLITWHELAYRSFIPASEREFELGGLVSHAGSDLLLLAGLLLTISLGFAFVTAPRRDTAAPKTDRTVAE